MLVEPIARIRRTSGSADDVCELVFEPAYRGEDALRGIEGFDYLWLIWSDSEAAEAKEPLSGQDALELAVVRLDGLTRKQGRGTVLVLSECALPAGTPVFDIKPYLPFVDA